MHAFITSTEKRRTAIENQSVCTSSDFLTSNAEKVALIFCVQQFNKLPTSEHAVLQVAVHVDPANSFDDGSFHHAPCRVSLRYQEAGGSCAASVIKTHEMTQITFFSPGKT